MNTDVGKEKTTYQLNVRIPASLQIKIRHQQEAERIWSQSEMVRILIEDGLQVREQAQKAERGTEPAHYAPLEKEK